MILLQFLLTACIAIPEGITPVSGFDLQKYLGEWYEVARLDHSFERGLQQVTARYELMPQDTDESAAGISVINRGFSVEDNNWNQASGKAYFVEDPGQGYLKVSFFRPFYGAYIIFELDDDYQYAFVCSNSRDYLWLLSRTPVVSEKLQRLFIEKSSALGFDTNALIWVKQ